MVEYLRVFGPVGLCFLPASASVYEADRPRKVFRTYFDRRGIPCVTRLPVPGECWQSRGSWRSVRPLGKSLPVRQGRHNAGPSTQARSQQVALPACLEKLNLAPQQQAQIQEIVRDYDADVASVWKQFSGRYLETIRTEATLLSAIEDNLTEPQRQQVRDQRRRVAQHEKAIAGTNGKAKQETVKPVRGRARTRDCRCAADLPSRRRRPTRSRKSTSAASAGRIVASRAFTIDWCRWKRTSSWRSRRFSRKINCSNCVRFARVRRPPYRLRPPVRWMRCGPGEVSRLSRRGEEVHRPATAKRSFLHFHPIHTKGIHRETHLLLTGTHR